MSGVRIDWSRGGAVVRGERIDPAADPTRATSGFGATLRRLREATRTSQSRLAERAGYDHSYVCRLEIGARNPTRDAVVRLAEALGLNAAAAGALLAAAGYLPPEFGVLLAGEPEVVEVLNLLRDETIPADYRLNLREILRLMAQQAKAVRPTSDSRTSWRDERGTD